MSATSNKITRTRFAPSPTGYLHLGGARTALFSWLYAKQHRGHFVLRIEDTDPERSSEVFTRAILQSMNWLDLSADEGPFYQTQRMDRYREVIEQLLESGNAYRCYCTKERLERLRAQQLESKHKPRYDGHCRDLAKQEQQGPFVIRFRNPTLGVVKFTDLIRGEIIFENKELDDLIIARTDGTPTYNLTVVVDDWDMKITQVIRGDDHINNTPRQINILKALNVELPEYAHLPMILGSDGKRLSKRHGAVSVTEYMDQGYLPEALLNYLVRLGWAHGDQEIFSLKEMIQLFKLHSVNRSPAAFNPEKLLWLNQHYLKTRPPSSLIKPFSEQLRKLGIDDSQGPGLESVIVLQVERCKTLLEMAERSQYFYCDVMKYDPVATEKHLTPEIVDPLQHVCEQLKALPTWEKELIHQIILAVAEAAGLKLGKLAQPIRVAVTGGTVSPPIDATLALIGRERVLTRLQNSIVIAAQPKS